MDLYTRIEKKTRMWFAAYHVGWLTDRIYLPLRDPGKRLVIVCFSFYQRDPHDLL